jgi:hypothetical protein
MFIIAAFIIAYLWNQTRCPITNEWIKKIVYTHNGILFSYTEDQNCVICRKIG